MNTRRNWVLVLILTLTIGGAGVPEAQNGKSVDLSKLLDQVKDLVTRNKIPEALEKLEEGKALADATQSKQLELVEGYYWEAAIRYQDFANQLKNQDQKRQYTGLARDKFQNYIRWYQNLTDEEKKRLKGQVHIMLATLYMGQSIIGTNGAVALFNKYGEIIDVRYLNSDALELWRKWLRACPKYSAPNDSLEWPPQNLCMGGCKPQWKLYGQTLQDWAKADWSKSNIVDVPKKILDLRSTEGDDLMKSVEKCGARSGGTQ